MAEQTYHRSWATAGASGAAGFDAAAFGAGLIPVGHKQEGSAPSGI
jgi:hypothetical protein